MANQPTNPGIKKSWSLLDFARSHGRMQVGDFVNKETGEAFKSCIFTDPNDSTSRCFVHFSSKMGPMSPGDIAANKNSLQVVELQSGSYVLCTQGDNAWQDVNLGI